MMYLSFDGGGTTTRAILFDEHGPLGYGQSGGTNTNFTSLEDCRGNIIDCLEQALSGFSNVVLECVFAVIVGPVSILEEELRLRSEFGEMIIIGEGKAGLLAGALRESGLVAMSGTGSDAFYVAVDGRCAVVGAYGSILGDDGSGAWIGQRAIRNAIAYGEGWGEPTIFRDMIYDKWYLAKPFDIVEHVYGAVAPYRLIASSVPVVAEAAKMGDAFCLNLFAEAGRLMAVQMLALIKREDPSEPERLCVCCGGTWKAHPLMYETFEREMRMGAPDVAVKKPAFEHVMAGVVAREMRERANIDAEILYGELARRYESYKITW
jgi:N-acetylglucosamine kinase-like BadF-type ATPase